MSRSRKKKSTHQEMAVRQHLALRHPNCPAEVAEAIVAAIQGRAWDPPVTLGQAVGIVSSNLVRHRLTDYEALMRRHRLTRDEARLVVAPEVAGIITGWR